MKSKKLIALLLCVSMAISVFAISAGAEPAANEAKIGETEYATFAEALAAAEAGNAIELLADISGDYLIDKGIVLNGEDHQLSGKLTISAKGVEVNKLNIVAAVSGSGYGYTINVATDVSLKVVGGSVKNFQYGLMGSFSTAHRLDLSLDGVTFSDCTNKGMYGTNFGDLTVKNCSFINCDINPGGSAEITRSGSAIDVNQIYSGGNNIVIVNNTFKNIDSTGGTAGAIKIKVRNAEKETDTSDIKNQVGADGKFKSIEISGNTFEGCVRDVVFGTGDKDYTHPNCDITLGDSNIRIYNFAKANGVNDMVAKVGKVEFNLLSDAVAAAVIAKQPVILLDAECGAPKTESGEIELDKDMPEMTEDEVAVLKQIAELLVPGDDVEGLAAAAVEMGNSLTAEEKIAAEKLLGDDGKNPDGLRTRIIVIPVIKTVPIHFCNPTIITKIKIEVYGRVFITTAASAEKMTAANSRQIKEVKLDLTDKAVDLKLVIPYELEEGEQLVPTCLMRHEKDDGSVYFHRGSIVYDAEGKKVTVDFTVTHGFSTFFATADDLRVINVDYEGGTKTAYEKTDVGAALSVAAEKDGYEFEGWSFAGVKGKYTVLTEELWELAVEAMKDETIVATASYRKITPPTPPATGDTTGIIMVAAVAFMSAMALAYISIKSKKTSK